MTDKPDLNVTFYSLISRKTRLPHLIDNSLGGAQNSAKSSILAKRLITLKKKPTALSRWNTLTMTIWKSINCSALVDISRVGITTKFLKN